MDSSIATNVLLWYRMSIVGEVIHVRGTGYIGTLYFLLNLVVNLNPLYSLPSVRKGYLKRPWWQGYSGPTKFKTTLNSVGIKNRNIRRRLRKISTTSGRSHSPHTLYNKINQFSEFQFHTARCLVSLDRIIHRGCTVRYYLLPSLECELLNHQEIKYKSFYWFSP